MMLRMVHRCSPLVSGQILGGMEQALAVPFQYQCHLKTTTTTTTTMTRCLSSSTNSGKDSTNGKKKKKNRRGGRHFAYKKNEKERAKQEKNQKKRNKSFSPSKSQSTKKIAATPILPPDNIFNPEPTIHPQVSSKLPPSRSNNETQPPKRFVPPAMLLPTGSPHVYVARTALEDASPADAQSLFYDYQQRPKLFSSSQFEYFPPKAFQYEYPKQSHQIAEVAFLGRSNVGKSSLVNASMRRSLAKTSKSPGRTQTPFYYGLLSKKHFLQKKSSNFVTSQDSSDAILSSLTASVTGYLVDLPGYGYGMAPQEVVEGWQGNTQEWLLDRRDAGVLKRLFLLLDSRRGDTNDNDIVGAGSGGVSGMSIGPASPLDQTVMDWAEEAQIPYTIVLTKADRVSVPKVIKQVNDLCLRYSSKQALHYRDIDDEDVDDDIDDVATYQSPIIHVTSSQANWGINELLMSIEAEFRPDDDSDSDDDDEDFDDDDLVHDHFGDLNSNSEDNNNNNNNRDAQHAVGSSRIETSKSTGNPY